MRKMSKPRSSRCANNHFNWAACFVIDDHWCHWWLRPLSWRNEIFRRWRKSKHVCLIWCAKTLFSLFFWFKIYIICFGHNVVKGGREGENWTKGSPVTSHQSLATWLLITGTIDNRLAHIRGWEFSVGIFLVISSFKRNSILVQWI